MDRPLSRPTRLRARSHHKRWTLALLALLLPAWAGAVDMDYYTYNAFDETVAAFQRLALILQHPTFTVYAGLFAVLGIAIGALTTAFRGISGGQVNPIAFLLPVVVGVALFRGLVWPTGTLYVYDPVRNANQAVGDVPDAIVLLAGLLNKLERGVADIIQTASADPDAERAGSLRYSLILAGLQAKATDTVLERNVVNYYLDCGIPSMALGYNGASQSELKRGTADLYTTFERWRHPTLTTVYFTGAGDSNELRTCGDTWAAVAPALADATALRQIIDTVCVRGGFNAADPVQMASCETELGSLGSLYGQPAASAVQFVRSAQLANGITQALRSADISVASGALMDRQVMAESFGAAEAMDRWIPKLRGFMLATALGVFPLALLFVMTPLAGRALMLCVGLFAWLALWGVADAISVAMASDAAADAFDQMRQMGYSYDALMLSPEGAVQAIGVFGKARAMAMGLATVLSYAIFQFGGYAFTAMGNEWQKDLQGAGEAAGTGAMLPEQRAAAMAAATGSLGTPAAVERNGFGAVSVGASADSMSRAGEGSRVLHDTGYVSASASGAQTMRTNNPQDAASVYEARGVARGAELVGDLRGRTDEANRRGTNLAEMAEANAAYQASIATSGTVGERTAVARLGGTPGVVGEYQGTARAAEFATTRELRGSLSPGAPESLDAALAAQRLAQGSALGAARAVEGDPERYIAARELDTGADIATAAAVRAGLGGNAEERLGAVRAVDTIANTRGVESALAVSPGGYESGIRLDKETTAARGVAATESGGTRELALAQARQSIGETLGRIDATQRAGDLLGIDTSTTDGIAELTSLQQRANVSIPVTDDPAARAALAERLEIGANNPDVLDSFVNGPPGVVSLAVTDDGRAGAVNYRGGSTATVDDSARTSNESRYAYGTNIEGGVAVLQKPGVLEERLERAWAANEDWGDGVEYNAIARAMAADWSQQGLDVTARRSEQLAASVAAGLGLSLAGTGVNGRTELADSSSLSTSESVNITLAEAVLDSTREATVRDFDERYGEDTWREDSSLQREFTENWASLVRQTSDQVLRDGMGDTAMSRTMHDSAHDALGSNGAPEDDR